jgi:hypothetical protein
MTVIMQAVLGSTAYGLAREGSDIDRLGVFVAPTLDVAGLYWNGHKETVVRHEPSDTTHHEIAKFLRLALGCNPTLLELLWLPQDDYEIITQSGRYLRALRRSLLFEDGVRNAYGGYAYRQTLKLKKRGDSFSSDTVNRTAKHGRHMLRLQRQGRQLLETGELIVRVDDPEEYWAFDDMTVDQMLEVFEREDALFRACKSVLPEQPQPAAAEALLRSVRAEHL